MRNVVKERKRNSINVKKEKLFCIQEGREEKKQPSNLLSYSYVDF